MFTGLEREQATEAEAGDIVLVTGIEQVGIGVTTVSYTHLTLPTSDLV